MKKKSKQKVLSYLAIFEPAEEGGFNVSFPNFPGCVTFGETLEESQKMAQEALQLWIETLSEVKKVKKLKQKNFIAPIISPIIVEVAA